MNTLANSSTQCYEQLLQLYLETQEDYCKEVDQQLRKIQTTLKKSKSMLESNALHEQWMMEYIINERQ